MPRLRSGKDWQRQLEDCQRNKAFEVFQMSRIEVCPSAFPCHAGMQSGMSPIADGTLAVPSCLSEIAGHLVEPHGSANQ